MIRRREFITLLVGAAAWPRSSLSDQSFNAFAWSQIPRYLDRVFLIFGHEQTPPASPAFLFE
jgi:hypothetical protein